MPSLGAHGGGGSGRTTIQSFAITKAIDKSSPLLLQAAATGKLNKDAVLAFSRKAGSKEMDYLKFDFQQVFISSVTEGTSSGNETPTEQVTFNFQKCKETFINSNGKVGQTVNFNVGTPLASALARTQCAAEAPAVSSLLHANVRLEGELEPALLGLLDGNHDRKALSEQLSASAGQVDAALERLASVGLLQRQV
jgi:type VI protein secretion system component Hcp